MGSFKIARACERSTRSFVCKGNIMDLFKNCKMLTKCESCATMNSTFYGEELLMSSSIEISKVSTKINFAKGVDVSLDYYNASGKEIKYLTFTFVPYNAVNDVVCCTISEESEKSGQITGPIKVGSVTIDEADAKYNYFHPESNLLSAKWSALWYNNTVTSVKVIEINITYMDGSEETIAEEDIVYLNDENSTWTRDKKVAREEFDKLVEKYKEEEKIKEEKRAEEDKKWQAEQDIINKKKRTKGIIIAVVVVILCIVYTIIMNKA